MAYFAEINENNIVLRVIVVADDDCFDQFGNENEAIGALFCHQLLGGRWLQTSYNGRIRSKYAAIDDRYDGSIDAFVSLPEPTLEEETP